MQSSSTLPILHLTSTVLVIGFFVVLTATAYGVRGLQLFLGSSKRTLTERAEELGNESDAIPLADVRALMGGNSEASFPPTPYSDPSTPQPLDDLIVPQRTQDPSRIRGTGGPPETDVATQSITSVSQILQSPLPLTRPQRWAFFINSNFDKIAYLILFLFIGLPIYYAIGYAMPAQLTFNILAYFAALSLPVKWRRFLHPVLVSAGITILGIWILGLIRGDSLTVSLEAYKTGTSYVDLWQGKKNMAAPGAGDILVSQLDLTRLLFMHWFLQTLHLSSP
jgi:hypothetical protein